MKFVLLLMIMLTSPLAYPANSAVCKSWSEPKKIGELDPRILRETSGLVASRNYADRLYHIADGEKPPKVHVTGFDGQVRATITIPNLDSLNIDTEELAYGPCGKSQCIFVGNIGDNLQTRAHVEVLYFKEEKTWPHELKLVGHLKLSYPDGPHNAEAMIVHPSTGELFIFTKEQSPKKILIPPTRIYKLSAAEVSNGGEAKLKLVGILDLAIFDPGGKRKEYVVTGASVSPDGKKLLLVTKAQVFEISWDFKTLPTAKTQLKEGVDISTVSIKQMRQPEAISYLSDGKSFLVTSESGKKRGSPILKFDCLK